jgi:hypothetical protein
MAGNDDLPLLDANPFQRGHGGLSIKAIDLGLDKPARRACCRRLASLSPAGHFGRIDGSIANHSIEPGHRVVRGSVLPDQFDERILDHILGLHAPLPCAKHEGRGMLVDQSCDLCWGHYHKDYTEGRLFRGNGNLLSVPKKRPGGLGLPEIAAYWEPAGPLNRGFLIPIGDALSDFDLYIFSLAVPLLIGAM